MFVAYYIYNSNELNKKRKQTMKLIIEQDHKTYKYSDTPNHGELYIYNFLNKEKNSSRPFKRN